MRSNAPTINEPVGDNLSLGDADFEFQPTSISDQRLIKVCQEVEQMLNKQLLQQQMLPRHGARTGSQQASIIVKPLHQATSGSALGSSPPPKGIFQQKR